MRRSAFITLSGFALLLAGCAVGPNYHRPVVNVPATYRNPATDEAKQSGNNQSLGDEKWYTVFQDVELQKLIRTGLQQNFDLRIAAQRVLASQAQVTITRSNQFPTFSAGPGYNIQQFPRFGTTNLAFKAAQVTGAFSWNPDFWGLYRRATESARAALLADEWNRRTVTTTLIQNLAVAYFQLREFDLELEISRRTLDSRNESLRLTQTLLNGGATSIADVRQAEQLVETAAEEIPDIEREIQQAENQVKLLLGENPGVIVRGKPLAEQPLPDTIPAGLPSSLLERRPDIRQAEQQLVSANAQIGVARAQLFPQVSLSGTGGTASSALDNLFQGGSWIYNATGSISQPIFNAGRLRAQVRQAQAQQQEALFSYQQTIQSAFRDVSNDLIAYIKFREFREHQERLTTAAREASDLAHTRYDGGVTSYLEVLTNETNFFSAELNLARARLNERLTLVQVYNALGGGWQL